MSVRCIRILACAAMCLTALLGALELGAYLMNEYWSVPINVDGRTDFDHYRFRNARVEGVSVDGRPVGEAIQSLRNEGLPAVPLLSVAYFMDAQAGAKTRLNGVPVLPLSLAPNTVGLYCNEHGSYARFLTDRYGFRNPDVAWDSKEHALLVVGDSIAMGACLPLESSFVGRIRSRYPTLLNLAIGANGPLMDLATLREYLPVIKPAKVLWVYFENDLEDLARDAANPILRRYEADPAFSQQLLSKWDDLSGQVLQKTEEYLTAVRAAELAQRLLSKNWSLGRSYLVRRIRYWMRPSAPPTTMPPPERLVQIMRNARDFAEQNESRFSVLYVPDCGAGEGRFDHAADEVLSGLRAHGITVIDSRPALSEIARNKGRVFSFCPGGHITSDASKAIAALL